MVETKITKLPIDNRTKEIFFYEKRWFILLQLIISKIYSIPPIKRYFAKSNSFLTSRIPKIYKKGKYLEALELSCNGLERCKISDKVFDNMNWWAFMSYGVYCAHMLNSRRIMKRLLDISKFGPKPFDGHYASYSFCKFSHFMYLEGDYNRAIKLAEKAMSLDESAGEPHYLLGYYKLFVHGENPVENFKTAVEKDNSILNRIVYHPSLQEFPGIISEIKKIQIIDSNTSSNKAHSRGRS